MTDPLKAKSSERHPTNNQSGSSSQPGSSATTKPKGSNSPGRKGKAKRSNSPPGSPIGKVMSVQADPFTQWFNHWPACEEPWNVVCAIVNSIMRIPNDVSLWISLTEEEKAHLLSQLQG